MTRNQLCTKSNRKLTVVPFSFDLFTKLYTVNIHFFKDSDIAHRLCVISRYRNTPRYSGARSRHGNIWQSLWNVLA